MSCPTDDLLVALALARAAGAPPPGGAAAEAARRHAAGCADCRALVAAVEAALAGLARPLPEVPARLRRRAARLARAGSRRGGGVLEVLARLVLDSRASPAPAFGLRGEGVSERHLLYRDGSYEIDVALLEDGTLVGQVLPPPEGPALAGGACLLTGEDRLHEAPLHENGDFRFPGVGPGSYALVVDAPPVEIHVPDLDFAAEDHEE